MTEDLIRSASRTSTGTLVSGRGRLLGIYFRAAATAGTVVLKDGGASGAELVTIPTPAAIAGSGYHPIPKGGIPFGTDLHVTLTTADGITVYYAEDRTP